jgi:hypothetical protein
MRKFKIVLEKRESYQLPLDSYEAKYWYEGGIVPSYWLATTCYWTEPGPYVKKTGWVPVEYSSHNSKFSAWWLAFRREIAKGLTKLITYSTFKHQTKFVSYK